MAPRKFDRFMISDELGANAKVGRLTDREFRCLVTGVWSLAAKATPRGYLAVAGTPADEHDVARLAHCTVAVAKSTLAKLRQWEMLERDDEHPEFEYVHDWHELNPDPKKDTTAADRQRRRRSRQRDGHGGVTP